MSYDHGRLYYDSDAGFIEDYESMHGALVRQDFMDYSHQQDRTRQAEASSAGSASRYGSQLHLISSLGSLITNMQ